MVHRKEGGELSEGGEERQAAGGEEGPWRAGGAREEEGLGDTVSSPQKLLPQFYSATERERERGEKMKLCYLQEDG